MLIVIDLFGDDEERSIGKPDEEKPDEKKRPLMYPEPQLIEVPIQGS